MLLTAVDDETYCLKTLAHAPYDNGAYSVCYRCGMLLGPSEKSELGSLLDY
jgi:hypothetical protein